MLRTVNYAYLPIEIESNKQIRRDLRYGFLSHLTRTLESFSKSSSKSRCSVGVPSNIATNLFA